MKGENGNKRTRDPQRTRRNIVEAAFTLFAKKGPDGTSMREIAGESGESLSNIYYYFDDKVDLFRSVMIERSLGDLSQVLVAEMDDKGDSIERLRRLLQAYAEMVSASPRTAMMIIHGLLRVLENEEQPTLQLFKDRIMKIEQIIQEGKDKGEIKDVDPRLYSNFLIGLVIVFAFNGMAKEKVEEWPGTAFSAKEFAEFLDATVISSLRE